MIRRLSLVVTLAACGQSGGSSSEPDTGTAVDATVASEVGPTTTTETGVDGTGTDAGTSTAPGATDPGATDPTIGADSTTGTDPTTDGPTTDTGDTPAPDLEGAPGCAGVYNPDQILDLHLAMEPGDWQTVLGDLTFAIYVPAQFHCGDEPPITVGVRRKRSGGLNKVGLKVDFNELVQGQRWHDLRKLSLENGVSSGANEDDAEVRDLVSEYLGWRIVQRAGVTGSRAVFANLHVNREWIGAYVNVEQVDTRFLKDRFGDNDGWLMKKSGGDGDGLQTHEDDGLTDPYAAFLCFWEKGGGACEPPSTDVLLAELPQHLDIPKMLRMGAVNAYIANTDSPLFKDNNWYYYDWAGGGRVYMPTDLDTTMKDFTTVAPMDAPAFAPVLFTHWYDDYTTVLTEVVDQLVPAAVVLEELDRALAVAGPSLDDDPWTAGTAAEAVEALGTWWTEREADVRAQLGL